MQGTTDIQKPKKQFSSSVGCLSVPVLSFDFSLNVTFLSVLDFLITARKRSLRRLCFHTCLSVILLAGGAYMVGEHSWWGGMHGRGACKAGGVHGRGCMAGGMCGRGGMHVRGCACRGACMAGGHVWQGVCMAGSMCGGGCTWQIL